MMIRMMLLGLALVSSLLVGCGEDDEVSQIPQESTLYARAAVEVGTINISQMDEYAATIDAMAATERRELWLNLKQLHDQVHPAGSVAHVAGSDSTVVQVPPGGGCSPSRCSHSTGCKADWCCAFGEDAVFYSAGGCPAELD